MEDLSNNHKDSLDTQPSSPLFPPKNTINKPKFPAISLSKHFSNSKFQEKLKIENKVAMFKLKIISTVCCSFMIIEFICGYLAGSLAIMSDATHLLSDLAGFLISLFSLIVAMKPADRNFTFGYHRFEVLGALASILIIWGLTVWLLMAAIWRIQHPNPIVGFLMVCIAAGGLLFNIIMNRVLAYNPVANSMDDGMGAIKKSSEDGIDLKQNSLDEPLLNDNIASEELKHNLNADDNPVIRAAYIHILGDMIQSAGVLLAALIIYFYQDTHPGVRIVDPICTFCFAIVVLCTTLPVSRDCFYVLLESTPRDLDIESLYNDLSSINGVISVHDIHLWNISIGRPSIALHIICDNPKDTLKIASQTCKNYGIKHCTIQTETELYNCKHDEENDIH